MLVRRNYLVIFRNILLSCVLFNIFDSYETSSLSSRWRNGTGPPPPDQGFFEFLWGFELVRSDGSVVRRVGVAAGSVALASVPLPARLFPF